MFPMGFGMGNPNLPAVLNPSVGLQLVPQAIVPADGVLYLNQNDGLQFGPTKLIEKATLKQLVLSQNVTFNQGDYWDLLQIPFMEFGFARVVIESAGGSHGSYREFMLPLSYANDVFYSTLGNINGVWVYAAPKVAAGRVWGDNFRNNYALVVKNDNGVMSFRLLNKVTGEMRGAPYDYGNATIRVAFYLSAGMTGSSLPTILTTNGSGMALPTVTLPVI